MKKILFFIILCCISFSIVSALENKYVKIDSFNISEKISSMEFVDEGAGIYSIDDYIGYDYYFRETRDYPVAYYGIVQDDSALISEEIKTFGEYFYNYFYSDDSNIITVGIEDGNYYYSNSIYTTVVSVFDNKMNLIKKINLPIDFKFMDISFSRPWHHDNGDDDFKINKYENDYMLFLKKNNFSLDNLSCVIAKINSDFEYVDKVDCSLENLNKYFSDVVYEYSNNLNGKVYYHDDEDLFVSDNHTLSFYKSGELIENITYLEYEEISDIVKVNDKVVVTKRVNIRNSDKYIDEILIYDEKGILLQEINDNSAYVALNTKGDNGDFMVLKRYTDGLCGLGSYGSRYLYCDNKLSYDVYSLKEEIIDITDTTNNDSNVISNPDTHDIAIFSFIILLLGSLLLVVIRKKIDF